jgi:hypothetical protein
MSNALQISATWTGNMYVAALVGHLSLYRPDSYALALLQLADTLGGLTEADVDRVLLAGQRRQIARRMVEQSVRDRALFQRDDGRYDLTEWGRASLKEDQAAWVEHAEGAWMALVGDQLAPLFAGLPVLPIAALDEKADANDWDGLPAELIMAGDQRYPGFTTLLRSLATGSSFDGWFGQRREKLLINPLSDPPKIRIREVRVQLRVGSAGTGSWTIEQIEFPQMKSLAKLSHGLVGQTAVGFAASFFGDHLRRAGYEPLAGGLYLPSEEKLVSASVNLQSREFKHRLSVGGWDVSLVGRIGAAHLDQALDWFVRYGLKESGVQSMGSLSKEASDYVRTVGLDPAGLDQGALSRALGRSRPAHLNRAARSRALYPLFFAS